MKEEDIMNPTMSNATVASPSTPQTKVVPELPNLGGMYCLTFAPHPARRPQPRQPDHGRPQVRFV